MNKQPEQSYESYYYHLALTLTHGVGSQLAKKLVEYAGSPRQVFELKAADFVKIPGMRKAISEQILSKASFDLAEKELQFLKKHGIRILAQNTTEYPQILLNYVDAPFLMFYKGKIDLNQQPMLSIVGTRKASKRVREFCTGFIKELNDRGHNPVIISGLALGIDTCAHEAALEAKLPTLAVLGHGLDHIYPARNKELARKIIQHGGGLLTEYASKSYIGKENFVLRNRIVAGMAQATIVAESPASGGSLITAKIANNYNKDVFAIPGFPDDQNSSGCNALIKNNQAHLLESVDDLENVLNWKQKSKPKQAQQKELFIDLSKDEKQIYDLLAQEEYMVDQLVHLTSLPISRISVILFELEMKALIVSKPGNRYKLL